MSGEKLMPDKHKINRKEEQFMKLKKILASVMALALLTTTAAISAAPANAATSTYNPAKEASLTINKFARNDQNEKIGTGMIEGVHFAITKIANLGENLKYADAEDAATKAGITTMPGIGTTWAAEKATVGGKEWIHGYTGNNYNNNPYEGTAVVFDNLPHGIYYVHEYFDNGITSYDGQDFVVSVPTSGTYVAAGQISGSNTGWVYDVVAEAKNNMTTTSAQLTKLDLVDNTKKLQNFVFELYIDPLGDTTCTPAGKTGETTYAKTDDDKLVGTYTTDENGLINVDGLNLSTKYYFKEITPVGGYILDTRAYEFTTSNKQNAATTATVTAYDYDPSSDQKDKAAFKKEVTTAENQGKISDAKVTLSRGDVANYTISVKVPTNVRDLTTFTVTDVYPAGLGELANVKVAGATAAIGYTHAAAKRTLTFTIDAFKAHAGDTITITYDLKAQDNIAVTNTNKATLTYVNGKTADNHTNTEEANVYSGQITITKKDKNNSTAPVVGAEFKIRLNNTTSAEDTNYVKDHDGKVVVLTTDDQGTISFIGLEAGTYYLEEVKVPAGYQLMTSYQEFTIAGNSLEQAVNLTDVNNTDLPLPLTGGTGTLIFTIIGLALIGTAGVLFVVAKKRQAN